MFVQLLALFSLVATFGFASSHVPNDYAYQFSNDVFVVVKNDLGDYLKKDGAEPHIYRADFRKRAVTGQEEACQTKTFSVESPKHPERPVKSKDGEELFEVENDLRVIIKDAKTKEEKRTLRFPTKIHRPVMSRDDSRVFIVGINGDLWIWNRYISELERHKLPKLGPSIPVESPEGRYLYFAFSHNALGAFDLVEQKMEPIIKVPKGKPWDAQTLLSPDGSRLFIFSTFSDPGIKQPENHLLIVVDTQKLRPRPSEAWF